MEGKLWYLKRCDLFEQLTPEQVHRIESCALVRMCKRQTTIYAPSEPGLSVFVLATGRVKIKHLTPDGKETILAFIEEGEIFGELALLGDNLRGEHAEAVEDSQILLIPQADFLWLMEQRSDLALSITKLVGLRRRRIENRLRNVLFLSSRERMVHMLLELMDSYGDRQGNVCAIRLPLTHQDLASLIGVTRETATVVLGQLQYDRLIKVQRRHITVLNCERLTQECSPAAKSFSERDPHLEPIPKDRGL